MSKELNNIRSLFNARLAEAGAQTFYAEIVRVDEAARTCTVRMNDIEYENVALYAVENPGLKGFVFIPAVGSVVLVCRIGGERYYVSMFSEIDKVLLTIGKKVEAALDAETLTYTNDKVKLRITASDVTLEADQITLNGGSFDGLVKVRELEKNLNNIKAFTEAIHTALPAAFTAVGAAMAAAGANGATSYNGSMAGKKIEIADMENPKVTH